MLVLRSVHHATPTGGQHRCSGRDRCRHGVQRVLRFRHQRSHLLHGLTRPTSAPFRARAPGPGIRPVRSVSGEGHAVMSDLPVAFRRTGIGLLGRPVPAGEVGPSSRSAYRAGHRPGLRRGFHVPHAQDTTGEGALYAPGRRCSRGRSGAPGRRLPLPSGQPYTPVEHPAARAHFDEASSRVRSRSPVRSSPHL